MGICLALYNKVKTFVCPPFATCFCRVVQDHAVLYQTTDKSNVCPKLLQDTIKYCESLDSICARTKDKYWFALSSENLYFGWSRHFMGKWWDDWVFIWCSSLCLLTDSLKALNSCAFQVTSCQLTHNYWLREDSYPIPAVK